MVRNGRKAKARKKKAVAGRAYAGKPNPRKQESWVIVRKSDGEAVREIYSKSLKDKVNTKLYKAVPVLEYLQSINKPSKRKK